MSEQKFVASLASDGQQAIDDSVAEIARHYMNGDQRFGDLITVILFKENSPVCATAFAKTILATVRLLNGLSKNQKRGPVLWGLVEAAIIGERAQFTLRPYPKAALKAFQDKQRSSTASVVAKAEGKEGGAST